MLRPIRSNENHELELSRVGAPSDSSGANSSHESQKPEHGVFIGNETVRQACGEFEMEAWFETLCISNGQGGGLVLFWHETVEVQVLEKHQRFIDVLARVNQDCPFIRYTFVYGEPRTEDRPRMWEHLRRLRNEAAAP